MNEIKVFNNSAFGQVRTAGTSENPLFCLSDVCKAVDLSNPSSVKARLDKDDVQLIDLHALNGGQEIVGNSLATFITESGFYEVILLATVRRLSPLGSGSQKRFFRQSARQASIRQIPLRHSEKP